MNHSQSPPAELEELTIAELRRAVAQGDPELTPPEALTRLADGEEVGRPHEQQQTMWKAYVEARRQCLAAVAEEAMVEVDRKQQRTGRGWPTREARFEARRDAGLEAEERFELEEPLLPFEDWVEAGAPERYRAEGPVARAEGLLWRFGSVGADGPCPR
jgi:hypothetical protein